MLSIHLNLSLQPLYLPYCVRQKHWVYKNTHTHSATQLVGSSVVQKHQDNTNTTWDITRTTSLLSTFAKVRLNNVTTAYILVDLVESALATQLKPMSINHCALQLNQTYDDPVCCCAPPINPYLSVCLSLVKPLISESDPKELSSSM